MQQCILCRCALNHESFSSPSSVGFLLSTFLNCDYQRQYILSIDINWTIFFSLNMTAVARRLPRTLRNVRVYVPLISRPLSTSHAFRQASTLEDPPRGNEPKTPSRNPPAPPPQESENMRQDTASASFLGTTKRLPEFNLTDKVILVSGAARGLGLTQAEALLEAGATVYALDRLPEPSPDFYRVQKRAAEELGTTFYYRQIDVRDVDGLNTIVASIGDKHGRMDGLIAAAGIQQETPALDYTAKDANMMFEINITGVFMTAQAVAKQMIKFGNGGSIAMIASMSAHIANRVCWSPGKDFVSIHQLTLPGPNLPGLQRIKSWCAPIGEEFGLGVGSVWHSSQYNLSWIHCHRDGRRTLPPLS